MCPGVESIGPAACPDCGMALEPEAPAAARTMYTCPMHPEVVKDEPGNCPDCGMALEATRIAAQRDNPEYRDMRRRFQVI